MRRMYACVVAMACFVSIVFSACSDPSEAPQGTSTVTVTTTGSGGSAGSGNSHAGGTAGAPNSPWPEGPGVPGTVVTLGNGMPFAQGLSVNKPVAGATYALGGVMCDPGQGGSAGSPGSGGSIPMDTCPTSYVATDPTMDLSAITNQTDIQVVVAAQPVLQPQLDGCDESLKSPGALYKGDCNGVVTQVASFTESDLTDFFGMDSILPTNTTLWTMGSGPVTLISGSSVRTAAAADESVFAISNASNLLLQFTPGLNPGDPYARTDLSVDVPKLSAIGMMSDGRVLLASMRTFTVDSWNAAASNNDPLLLVEEDPIRLKTFNPATGVVADFVTISAAAPISRVMGQSSIPATYANDKISSFFIAGSANVIIQKQGGGYLFSDRLNGRVYEISADGSSQTLVFDTFALGENVLLSGMAQPPNGVIYVVKSAMANHDCDTVVEAPKIAYWDENTQQLIDWYAFGVDEYSAVLSAICTTGVMERNLALDRAFLGAGLFVDLDYDSTGHLVVTTSLTGATTAIEVLPAQSWGAGGSGGSGP